MLGPPLGLKTKKPGFLRAALLPDGLSPWRKETELNPQDLSARLFSRQVQSPVCLSFHARPRLMLEDFDGVLCRAIARLGLAPWLVAWLVAWAGFEPATFRL